MIRLISSLILIASLTGCAQLDAIKKTAADVAARAAVTALRDAIWVVCKASPVGAVRVVFNTPDLMKTYNDICSNQSLLAANPAPPS